MDASSVQTNIADCHPHSGVEIIVNKNNSSQETSSTQPLTAFPGLAARAIAAATLADVLKGKNFHPLTAIDIFDPRDRALANKLVTTALRRHGHLNHVIAGLLKRGVPKRSGIFDAVLRLGLSQLLFMPDQAEHSAVHLSVELLRQDKRAGRFDKLLNGVLRQAQREKEKWQALGAEKLFPPWLYQDWLAQYGHEALESFGEALLAGAPLDLTLRDTDPELVNSLGAVVMMRDSVRIYSRDKRVDQLPFFQEGRWWVQDVAASLPARLFELSHGTNVLDMCAAPGGKTLQLAKSGYQVTALDSNAKRLSLLEENLERMKFKVNLVLGDARKFGGEKKFDGILLDAPCSSLGTFRRHPEVLWHRSAADIEQNVRLQREMIVNAVKNLGSGGQLIYCTCSLQKEEGEQQAEWVLHNFPRLKIDPVRTNELEALKSARCGPGYVRLHPGLSFAGSGSGSRSGSGREGGLDGFFVARFKLD